jgi:hypothetical protein
VIDKHDPYELEVATQAPKIVIVYDRDKCQPPTPA